MVELGGKNVGIQKERAMMILRIIKEDSEAIGRSVEDIGGIKKFHEKGAHKPIGVSRIRVHVQTQIKGEDLNL